MTLPGYQVCFGGVDVIAKFGPKCDEGIPSVTKTRDAAGSGGIVSIPRLNDRKIGIDFLNEG